MKFFRILLCKIGVNLFKKLSVLNFECGYRGKDGSIYLENTVSLVQSEHLAI